MAIFVFGVGEGAGKCGLQRRGGLEGSGFFGFQRAWVGGGRLGRCFIRDYGSTEAGEIWGWRLGMVIVLCGLGGGGWR